MSPHAIEPLERATTIAKVSVHGIRVNARGDWLFVRIETSEGHVGIGEISHSGDDAGVAAWIARRVVPKLVGQKLVGHQALARALRNELVKGQADLLTTTALSGIEQALWDVSARTLGVSVQTLLGGPVRTSIRLYANINRALTQRDARAFAAAARQAVQDGFRAVKIAPFDQVSWRDYDPGTWRTAVNEGIARTAAVREAIGPDLTLMIDCHGRFQREQAIAVARELEPLNLFWIEDLLYADEDPEGVAAVSAAIRQPQAAGERNLTLESFYPLVARKVAATLMPDVKHCGGLEEARRISALAEAARLSVSPHNPAGPVATLVSAHLAATLTNFVHLEFPWGEVPFRAAVLDPPEKIVDGHLELPLGPGFGAQLNPALFAEHGFDL
jgi:galactonate dehydratase